MSDAFMLTEPSIWHAGEKAIQESAGVADRMEAVGRRNVRGTMPDQHRKFFANLPFVVAGSVDDHGDPWATLVVGEPGFVASLTPTSLDIAARRDSSDPAGAGLFEGAAIGLLGIELDTRRRNRANGTIRAATAGCWHVEVDQSFGNCPQYIQLRDFTFDRDPRETFTADVEDSTGLDDAARAAISAADTFFVASYADREGRRQVDVSHRGGKRGFVRVGADGTLTIPDFSGNLFFMTLGNILLNGRAGLVFADFATGDLLQMTGDAEVVLDSPEIAAFQGAERLWTFHPRRVVRRRGALALRWSLRDDGWSPNSLMTGDWRQAAERGEAAKRWRSFKVVEVVDESQSVRSFHLRPDDGAGIIPSKAGQHIPIRVTLPGSDDPIVRTYTLSSAPSDPTYRISVKRDGVVSRHLHDHLRVGDTIETRAPAGSFTIDTGGGRPVVMLAGGIGITPLLAMIREIVHEGLRTRNIRPVTLFYAAHATADRAFAGELAELVASGRGAVRILRVLGDATGARDGVDYDAVGRIDLPLLARFLPFGDYDFFLCGPPRFAQALYDSLRGLNVADERIHAEAFGPSALVRSVPVTAGSSRPSISTEPVQVAFAESSKEARWTPGSGSLLNLAEAQGLSLAFGCRAGSCGTCKTRLLAGAVTYLREPSAEMAEGEVLICVAAPTQGYDLVRLAC